MSPTSPPTCSARSTGSDRGAAVTGDSSRIDGSVIDEGLVRALIEEQFPQWRQLPVTRVVLDGNDHRSFRLGDDLVVRLPSAPGYLPQVRKEQEWLPRLAPALPLPIPEVRGAGVPSLLFPAPWSVYGWIHGEPATLRPPDEPERFAADLAGFLVALRAADPTGGPAPGEHSLFRGAPVGHYADEMEYLVERVSARERDVVDGLWRDALEAPFGGAPVWLHGDVSLNNLLVRDGRLSAVIDFGCSAVGDPACDTTIFWTHFTGAARARFRHELAVDDATWARGRGWTVWKALIMIGNRPPEQRAFGRRVLDELIAEHDAA
jgi:aminoglycoside phosphotransferase (APT) family kinase protein